MNISKVITNIKNRLQLFPKALPVKIARQDAVLDCLINQYKNIKYYKMKKLIFAIALGFCINKGNAQIIITNESKITEQQAKSLAANVMASFTENVSFAYKSGISYDQFTKNLYAAGTETPPIFIEGNHMLEEAFKYLSNGTTKAGILKVDDGKAVASAMNVLYNQRSSDVITQNGSELFGSKNFAENPKSTSKIGRAHV